MIFTYLIASVCALIFYVFHKLVLGPYLVRRKYKKYPNVRMSQIAGYFTGDLSEIDQNMKNNVFTYWHYVDVALSKNKPDLYLKFIGQTPMFVIFSIKALKEFKKLQPNKIDRDSVFIDKFVGKLFYNSFAHLKSNNSWKNRRNSSMKEMGINFASGHIQTLIDGLEQGISRWKDGETINFTEEFSQIQGIFTSKTLFGKDFDLYTYLFDYHTEDGKIEQMTLTKFINKVSMDSFIGYYSPLGTILPFLNDYNLCQPYTRIMKNVKVLQDRVSAFIKSSTDKESLYHKLKALGTISEEDLLKDLLLLLFAGIDTTAHTTVSLLYFLKKNPEVLEKCKKVYMEQGLITENGINRDKFTIDNFDKCEYPEYTIKEALRIDHTAPETIAYRTQSDVKICGVPIPKDTLISIGLFGLHYDEDQWYEPLKFIPERFNAEHEYYKAPSTGKSREPMSFIPFSTGVRSCPGQTMGRLVQRIALPYLIANFDYDVDEEQLKNDKALFSNASQFHLKITVKKK